MRLPVLASCLALVPLWAGAQEMDQRVQLQAGQALFELHCATCHGLEATGNGPMAPILTVQPKNLPQLAAQNAGEFPLQRVIRRIDGRDPLVSHGSAMPVYGDFFEGNDTAMKLPSGQPIVTGRSVVDLVIYLQSLQGGL